jgi:hypothetical protein
MSHAALVCAIRSRRLASLPARSPPTVPYRSAGSRPDVGLGVAMVAAALGVGLGVAMVAAALGVGLGVAMVAAALGVGLGP